MSKTQTADTALMIRPCAFIGDNPQTSPTNSFMTTVDAQQILSGSIQKKALHEFDSMVALLRKVGIRVITVDDTHHPHTPDSVFPNNVFSFHPSGAIVLYPMLAPNRRLERKNKEAILAALKRAGHGSSHPVSIVDLTHYEIQSDQSRESLFLEGTGSMVFDHLHRYVYACTSPRTHESILRHFVQRLDAAVPVSSSSPSQHHPAYHPIVFFAADKKGRAVYHTNVLLAIGDRFAVICSEVIRDQTQRDMVLNALKSRGEVIDITEEQMNQFAGNVLQLRNHLDESFIVMSETALNAYTACQLKTLERFGTILAPPLPTIEIAGGSARCMLAEVFLSRT